MARKNRYEYELLRETKKLLEECSFYSSQSGRNHANEVYRKICKFLNEEGVMIPDLSPSRTQPVYDSPSMRWLRQRLETISPEESTTTVTDVIPSELSYTYGISSIGNNAGWTNGT